MLSRAQIILLQVARRDAGLDDGDYREAIATVSGMPDCRSSKDRRLTDGHLDKLLKFEYRYWTAPVELRRESSVFRVPDYWKNKNQVGDTSRDRFLESALGAEVKRLEAELAEAGCGGNYCAAIRRNLKPFTLRGYYGALVRTLKSKQRKAENVPF